MRESRGKKSFTPKRIFEVNQQRNNVKVLVASSRQVPFSNQMAIFWTENEFDSPNGILRDGDACDIMEA